MFTVNSPFFEMNSLVPSSGSTRKNFSETSGMRPAEAASSEITGTLPPIFAANGFTDVTVYPDVGAIRPTLPQFVVAAITGRRA